jgi:hypothetical protein
MSSGAMVFVRTKVENTSAGIETSAAPESSVKSNVILSLITTGTTYVPLSHFRAIDSAWTTLNAASEVTHAIPTNLATILTIRCIDTDVTLQLPRQSKAASHQREFRPPSPC